MTEMAGNLLVFSLITLKWAVNLTRACLTLKYWRCCSWFCSPPLGALLATTFLLTKVNYQNNLSILWLFAIHAPYHIHCFFPASSNERSLLQLLSMIEVYCSVYLATDKTPLFFFRILFQRILSAIQSPLTLLQLNSRESFELTTEFTRCHKNEALDASVGTVPTDSKSSGSLVNNTRSVYILTQEANIFSSFCI